MRCFITILLLLKYFYLLKIILHQADLEMLANLWKLSGRPTYIVMVTEAIVQAPNAKNLIDLLSSFKTGVIKNGVRVKQDRLQVYLHIGP